MATKRRLMGIRNFRDQITKIKEPVTVIRREEVLGTWTPAPDRREAQNPQKEEAIPAS